MGLRLGLDGTTAVVFGDGVEGGRLPTGKTNVRATYRKYTGTGGNLGKDRLTTLLQKPLGVAEVTNPEPATGGADPEDIADARRLEIMERANQAALDYDDRIAMASIKAS